MLHFLSHCSSRDAGFHVDDAEVTLNVCLGKDFFGGDLFFRGIRCDKHVNTETQPEVIMSHEKFFAYVCLQNCAYHRAVISNYLVLFDCSILTWNL